MSDVPVQRPEVALEKVVDEETFLQFLHALAVDRADEVTKEQEHPSSPYGPGANGWENGSIEDFLFAAVRWADDSGGAPMMPPKATNPWRRCADIIYCGKIYE